MGESSPYPNPNIEHTADPVSDSLRGLFVEAMEASDQVFWSPADNKNHTALKCTFMRHDGMQVDVIFPTELIVGFMERCVHHIGFIFPYRYYDAPTLNDQDVHRMMDDQRKFRQEYDGDTSE